jgi:hypothetical protein
MTWRRYGPNDERQEGASRLAYDEADLRRILGLARTEGNVSVIRLAGNISLSRPVVLSGTYNVVLDGGGKYGIRVAADYAHAMLFDVQDNAVSDILFRGLTFSCEDAATTTHLIRADNGSASLTNVSLYQCKVERLTYLLRPVTGNPSWVESEVEDVLWDIINPATGTNLTIRIAESVILTTCSFWRVYQQGTSGTSAAFCDLPTGSSDCTFFEASALNPGQARTADSSVLLSGGNNISILPGYLQAKHFVPRSTSSTLNTTNPSIAVDATGHFTLTLGAAAVGFITLPVAFGEGQLLSLYFVSVDPASTAKLVNGSGRFDSIAGDFTPTTGDVITFIGAPSGRWREVARSSVGGLTGSGASPRIAYWSGASALTSSSVLTYASSRVNVSGTAAADAGFYTESAASGDYCNGLVSSSDGNSGGAQTFSTAFAGGGVLGAIVGSTFGGLSLQDAVAFWGRQASRVFLGSTDSAVHIVPNNTLAATFDVDGKAFLYATGANHVDGRYTIALYDNAAFAAGVGAGIGFAGKYNSAGTLAAFAYIKAIKENGTDGDYAGALSFSTRANGGSPTERLRIASSGFLTTTANLDSFGTASFRNTSTGTQAAAVMQVINDSGLAFARIAAFGSANVNQTFGLPQQNATAWMSGTTTTRMIIATQGTTAPIEIGTASDTQNSRSLIIGANVGPVVVNEEATSTIDFRAEGLTQPHLLFADASADLVGIGTSGIGTGGRLNVVQSAASSGSSIITTDTRLTVSGSGTGQTIAALNYISGTHTGANLTVSVVCGNEVAGTGTALTIDSNYGLRPLSGNVGVFTYVTASGATTGSNYGVSATAQNGNRNYGGWFTSTTDKASAVNVGLYGAANNTGAGGVECGVFAHLYASTTAPTIVSGALVADNGTRTSPVLVLRDNATTFFEAADGGVITHTAGLKTQHVVAPRTSATSPAAADSRTVYTNEGTASQLAVTLPAAVAGLSYTFVVQDTDGIQLTAAAGDTIRVAGSVSSSGGTATASAVGDTITIIAINATEWIAIASHGTWTLA